MKTHFIKASELYSADGRKIPAPYLRRVFDLPFLPETASVRICGLGFYRLFVNGREITKGHLAPYISNPDHYYYYDEYDLLPHLKKGKNALGVILGNGMMNAVGGAIWDFDKAPWRGAPRVSLELCAASGDVRYTLVSDETFRVKESPIRFDDLRFGECYDAGCEIPGWDQPDFDDSGWGYALLAEAPGGEPRLCRAEPIRLLRTLKPRKILKSSKGVLFDFGVNTAGVCRLRLQNPKCGQQISLRYAEQICENELYINSVVFPIERFPDFFDTNQKDTYLAKGDALEEWTPSFTYHGFRYVEVEGLTDGQVNENTLAYLVMSSDLPEIGGFSCSDEYANRVFEMVKNADRSNFYYFPTDCPHREKNGWTGDASASSFQMMSLFDCSASYAEWLANIRKAQDESGALPGIVPTDRWGYTFGNGPAWDSVAFRLPYVMWKYRGNKQAILDNADTMTRYLRYVKTRRNENGLVAFGLGDWCSVDRRMSRPETPIEVTDSITVLELAQKAAEMFGAVGLTGDEAFAKEYAAEMRKTIRRELLDGETATLRGRTQTGQAMGLTYGVFEENEKEKAFRVLLDVIHEKNDSFDCGYLGMMTVFPILSEFGESELAYRMLMKPEYPSYRWLVDRGETALPEHFTKDNSPDDSHNHHFMGDVARWLIRYGAGLRVMDAKTVVICPAFLKEWEHASAYYDLPDGRVLVRWKRENGKIKLEYSCPDRVECRIIAPNAEIEKIRKGDQI